MNSLLILFTVGPREISLYVPTADLSNTVSVIPQRDVNCYYIT